MSAIGQGFPVINQPFVDQKGFVTQAWRQLLVSLWGMRGGVQGAAGSGITVTDNPPYQDIALTAPYSKVLLASENLAAGAMVNVWNDAGTGKIRNADATDDTKPAHGFVLTAVTAGETEEAFFVGLNTALSGLTPGAFYYLSETPGAVTLTEPTLPAVTQRVGFALSATVLLVMPEEVDGLLTVEDEGVVVDPAVTRFNFTGAGVVATQTAPGEVQVAIAGGSSPDVAEEGVVVNTAPVTLLDFTGAGATATESAPGQIVIAIPGGGGGSLIVQEAGVVVDAATGTLNFTGLLTATQTAPGVVDVDLTLTGADVTGALGFTPYNATNPAGYITGISGADVVAALGYTPYSNANPAGYISGNEVVTLSGDATGSGATAIVVNIVRTVSILISDPAGADLTTGDAKAYWRVPAWANGKVISAVASSAYVASSSGLPTVQIRRRRAGVDADVLSTLLTLDVLGTDSSGATTPAVIDPATDDLATADQICIDVDIAGTGTKGLLVEITVD